MKYMKSFEFFKNPFKKTKNKKPNQNGMPMQIQFNIEEKYIIDWMKKTKLERINFSLLPEIKIMNIGILKEIYIKDGILFYKIQNSEGISRNFFINMYLDDIINILKNMSQYDIEEQIIDQEANKFNF